jgi:hypothetical protein
LAGKLSGGLNQGSYSVMHSGWTACLIASLKVMPGWRRRFKILARCYRTYVYPGGSKTAVMFVRRDDQHHPSQS